MQRLNLLRAVRRWNLIAQPALKRSSSRPAFLRSRSMKPWFRSWPDLSDSDEEDGAPEDVPSGCLAVYVGGERKRFVIDAMYLNHDLFKRLLARSADIYGFCNQGGLTIACEAFLFEHLLWLMQQNDPICYNLQIEELLDFYGS